MSSIHTHILENIWVNPAHAMIQNTWLKRNAMWEDKAVKLKIRLKVMLVLEVHSCSILQHRRAEVWNTRATTKCSHPYLQILVACCLLHCFSPSLLLHSQWRNDKYWKVSIWSGCEELRHVCETVAAHKVELLRPLPPPSARNTSQISKKPRVSHMTDLLSQLSQKGWN